MDIIIFLGLKNTFIGFKFPWANKKVQKCNKPRQQQRFYRIIKHLLIIKNTLFSMKTQLLPPKNDPKKCKCDKDCVHCKITQGANLQNLKHRLKS